MVLEDVSVSGQVPTNSGLNDPSNAQELITVPDGEIWYVDAVHHDRATGLTTSPNGINLGITSAPNGFDDLNNDKIANAARFQQTSSPNKEGTTVLGEYAMGGDTIGLSFATGSDSGPYYRLEMRRVV